MRGEYVDLTEVRIVKERKKGQMSKRRLRGIRKEKKSII
jgi:hypothetical protein